jgi:hypothetical protein
MARDRLDVSHPLTWCKKPLAGSSQLLLRMFMLNGNTTTAPSPPYANSEQPAVTKTAQQYCDGPTTLS